MSGVLNTEKGFPHCPGCGHPHVLRALDEALSVVDYPQERVSLVTDIGCVGLADKLFPTMHTVHSLHGRSVAIASGLQMGDLDPNEIPLKPIVLIGDGGVGIGLLHVVHAAQTNVDVTVLVHNNLIYGMTGGQHSVLTPEGLKTTTTPEGSPIPNLDIGSILMGAGASFFARELAPGETLVSTIAQAIQHPGFACVEIFELCPVFASRKGGMTGKSIKELPEKEGLKLGILRNDPTRLSFKKGSVGTGHEDRLPQAPLSGKGLEPNPSLKNLDETVRMVVAGRAGERIQSAASLAASAATAAGLHVAVRSDNPVTQGTGFSLAELTISPDPITYTGLEHPELVIATAPEGYAELKARGFLTAPAKAKQLLLDDELEKPKDLESISRAYRKTFGGKNAALGSVFAEIFRMGWWKEEAWNIAIQRLPESRHAEVNRTFEKAKELNS